MKDPKRCLILVLTLLLMFTAITLASPTSSQSLDQPKQVQVKPVLKPWINITAPAANFGTADDHTIKITWEFFGVGLAGTEVKLEIYKGGQFLSTITPSCSIGKNGTGAFDWRISRNWALATGQGGGGDFQIKIISLYRTDVFDMSNNFWISQMVY